MVWNDAIFVAGTCGCVVCYTVQAIAAVVPADRKKKTSLSGALAKQVKNVAALLSNKVDSSAYSKSVYPCISGCLYAYVTGFARAMCVGPRLDFHCMCVHCDMITVVFVAGFTLRNWMPSSGSHF